MGEKAIVRKNEIVSTLNHIRLKHIAVKVKNRDNQSLISGYITKSDSNYISIFIDSVPDIVPIKNLVLSFEYNRNYYSSNFLDLRLLNLTIKSMEVALPTKLSHHLLRKFTRVGITGEAMKIRLKNIESNGNNKAAPSNIDELPETLKGMYLELMEEKPNIKRIVEMVGVELSRFSNRYRTNIFKDLKGLAPLERVVTVFKKTFWIADTENLNNYIHSGNRYNTIGYEKYFELIQRSMKPDVMEQIRDNYINRGIISYCMIPILIGDKVSGVIEVSVPDSPKYKKISVYDLFYFKGLADIMGEVVVKSKTDSMDHDDTFTVLNFSMGGILASTKNIYLTRSIKENSIVVLGLVLENKELEVTARVVRYDYNPGDNAGLNVAFEFLNMSENTKMEVGKFIRKFLKLTVNMEKTPEKE